MNKIAADIAAGRILPAAYYKSLDCDKCLDARNKDKAFVEEWMRNFQSIKDHWDAVKVDAELFKLSEDIRRESFLAVSRATQQHEIASYVSDDFDLIVRAKLLGMKVTLLEQMWAMYEQSKFPYPRL